MTGRTLLRSVGTLLWLVVANTGPLAGQAAQPAPHLEVLPPETGWSGASLALAVPPDHPWATPFEAGGMVDSPSYDETVAWLERLVAAAPELEMLSLGASPEGREIVMVVASLEGAASPEALAANGRPTLLAQAGIHPGEIDGKDAGMMLLRDLTVRGERRELLARTNLLFVPIFGVDGHERRSPFGRINQRGPATTGWRATSANLNLNRDYAKLDAPEMRHLVRAIDRWAPDLYLDLHVTDGADYQYDITYGWNGPHGWSPAIAAWLDEVLAPALARDLEAAGHTPGPLVFGIDPLDLGAGIFEWTAGPRFSTGWGDARHLPTVLVENHSLKSYPRRVTGTYVLLVSALETLGREAAGLAEATAADRAQRAEPVVLDWKVGDGPPPVVPFAGVEQRLELSPVSGALRVVWTGREVAMEVPVIAADEPAAVAERPAAYWIPPAWEEVIERLAIHGVEMERATEPREVEVTMYRLGDVELADMPFEGRVRVTATTTPEVRRERFPAGSVRVPTDQPLGELVVLLLEPAAPDSFFQWGFFHTVLSQIEYAEAYVLEPLAERMLAADPELAAEFRRRLATDAELRADPDERLDFFYRRTPYHDERHLLYPVAREEREAREERTGG